MDKFPNISVFFDSEKIVDNMLEIPRLLVFCVLTKPSFLTLFILNLNPQFKSLVLSKPRICANSNHENPSNTIFNRFYELNSVKN